MPLTYRGVSYEQANCYVESAPGNVIGSYRGVPVQAQNYVVQPAVHSSVNLKYRGTYYRPVTHIDLPTELVTVF